MRRKFLKYMIFSLVCMPSDGHSLSYVAGEENIFMCTKTLDKAGRSYRFASDLSSGISEELLEFLGESKAAVILDERRPFKDSSDSKTVFNRLEGTQHGLLNLRHCFLAFGIPEHINECEDTLMRIKRFRTHGYGVHHDGEPFKRRDTGSEQKIDEVVVSCVSIGSKSSIKKDIYHLFADAMRYMDEFSEQKEYNLLDHNCCTVAYHAASKAGLDLSGVNSENFNLMGVGVEWNTTNVSSWLSSLLSTTSSYITVKTINRHFIHVVD